MKYLTRAAGITGAVCLLATAALAEKTAPSGTRDADGMTRKAKAAAPAMHAELGKKAPDFTLTDLHGNEHTLSDYEGKTVVLEWFNPDCPFVKKHHKKYTTMTSTYAHFAEHDVVWLAINSGGKGKQGYGRERNLKAAEEYGMQYPVLLDPAGEVGRLYEAKTTPHMYVIDANGYVVYRGAIDDNRSPGKLGETNYVANCLASIAGGDTVEPMETKPYGCSVKYAASKTVP